MLVDTRITSADLTKLENRINKKLKLYDTSFEMTFHFSKQINNSRNVPSIKIEELEHIFDLLIVKHIINIVALDDGDSFNIKCMKSHINIPCEVEKRTNISNGTKTHKNIMITIMRKKNFKSKDPVDFEV